MDAKLIAIISLLIFLIGVYLLYHAKRITNQRIHQIEQTNKQIQAKEKQLKEIINQYKLYNNYISKNKEQLETLHSQQNRLNNELKQKQQNINKYYKTIKQQAQVSFEQYESGLDSCYKIAEQKLNSQIKEIQLQRDSVREDLNQLKSIYKAATAAKIREQEEQNKISFYKIQLTDRQIADISKLQDFKSTLYDPSLVSKVIWSSYVMKPTSEMCKRVLGTSNPICGIYKITNKNTGEIYVGQSVNIAQRWKTHIKAGLGIDTSTTNKLYKSMQDSGIFNFTFELLESCKRDQLNTKERFWIDMYSSNQVGLNMTKGVMAKNAR